MTSQLRLLWSRFLLCMGLLVFGSDGCGPFDSGSEEITVLVKVTGLSPEITSLFVSTKLNGAAAANGDQEITTRLDQFAVFLPRTTSGTLQVKISGRSAERCVVASGQADLMVVPAPPTFVEMTVALTSAAGGSKQCTLSVDLIGRGKITSVPAGLTCTSDGTAPQPKQCSFDFPVGTQVTLSSELVGKREYDTVFTGACNSTGTCVLPFMGPTKVKAEVARYACNKDNWCWVSPLPQGLNLHAIWGTASDDVWAVGDLGTILHYDGVLWKVEVPAREQSLFPLYGVHATARDDAWAVGAAGLIMHYDGKSWSVADTGKLAVTDNLRAVWAFSKTDVWVTGDAGTILHSDGTTWTTGPGHKSVAIGQLTALWGLSPTELWLGGLVTTPTVNQVFLKWNGAAWQTISSVPEPSSFRPIRVIRGTSSNLWAISADSFSFQFGANRFRYTGSAWIAEPMTGYPLSRASGLWATNTQTTFVGDNATMPTVTAARYVNSQVFADPYNQPTGPTMIWASADDDMWGVGVSGVIQHWDGKTWSLALGTAPVPPNTPLARAIWGTSATDVWAVGTQGSIRRFDGKTWSPFASPVGSDLLAIHGSQQGGLFAAGALGAVIRFSVSDWSLVNYDANTNTANLNSIWVAPTNFGTQRVWAVGDSGTLVSYNGLNVTKNAQSGVLTTNSLRSVWGTDSNNVYAVGFGGTVILYQSGTWRALAVSGTVPTTFFYSINGPALTNPAWITGSGGALIQGDRTIPLSFSTSIQSGTLTTNTAITSFSLATGVGWAPFAGGVLQHDPSRAADARWQKQNMSSANATPLGVWAASAQDVWVLGGIAGHLHRYLP